MTLTLTLMSPDGDRREYTNVKRVTDGEDDVRLTFTKESNKPPLEVAGAEIVSVEAHA